MSNRVKEAFEGLIAEMEDPPTWSQVSTPKARPQPSGRRPRSVWVAVAAFAVVLLFGVVGIILTSTQEPVSQSTGIGGEGPYFAIDDASWSLVRADDRGDGSFIGYQSGDRTVTISTGSVAEEEIQIAENTDPDLVSVEDVSTDGANVTRYVADEAVAYVWHTSSELPVMATFGSMSLEEAEQAARLMSSINPETFARMVETASEQ